MNSSSTPRLLRATSSIPCLLSNGGGSSSFFLQQASELRHCQLQRLRGVSFTTSLRMNEDISKHVDPNQAHAENLPFPTVVVGRAESCSGPDQRSVGGDQFNECGAEVHKTSASVTNGKESGIAFASLKSIGNKPLQFRPFEPFSNAPGPLSRTNDLRASFPEDHAVKNHTAFSAPFRAEPIQESHSELSGTKDKGRRRDLFFSDLSALLIQHNPSAINIWAFISTAPWILESRSPKIGLDQQRLLSEALRLTVLQCFHFSASNNEERIPRQLIDLYQDRKLMRPTDWAASLMALSRYLYETCLSPNPTKFSQKALMFCDLNRQLAELLKVWHCYFRSHQHTVPTGNTERIWKDVQGHPATDRNLSASHDYSARFLAFAPLWPEAYNKLLDRQLTCSSLMTLAAITKFLSLKTALKGTLSDNKTAILDLKPWAIENILDMSSNEFSFLYIVTHAADNAETNYTMLKLSLANLEVSAEYVANLVGMIIEFKSNISEALATQKSYNVAGAARALDSPLNRNFVKPVATLMSIFQSDKVVGFADIAVEACLELKTRHPRISIYLAQLICWKLYQLGHSSDAIRVFNMFPGLKTSKRLWVAGITHYFKMDDLAGFEQLWNAASLDWYIPEEIWQLRLVMYRKAKQFTTFKQVFRSVYWRSRFDVVRANGLLPPSNGTKLSVSTFNMAIEMMLRDGLETEAANIFGMLEDHPDVGPDGLTYRLFLQYSSRDSSGLFWLKKLKESEFEVTVNDCCIYFLNQLQQWPASARWADIESIRRVFNDIYWVRHSNWSLGSRVLKDDECSKVLGINIVSNKFHGDMLAVTYRGLLTTIFNNFNQEKRVQLAAIWMDHVIFNRHQLGYSITNLIDRFAALLESSPRCQVLALLSGDIWQPPWTNSPQTYHNFYFIRRFWGMQFITNYLDGSGYTNFTSKLRAMSWRGFHELKLSILSKVGVRSTTDQVRILWESSKLQAEAEYYATKTTKEVRKEQSESDDIGLFKDVEWRSIIQRGKNSIIRDDPPLVLEEPKLIRKIRKKLSRLRTEKSEQPRLLTNRGVKMRAAVRRTAEARAARMQKNKTGPNTPDDSWNPPAPTTPRGNYS